MPKNQIKKTTDLVIGTVGLGVASASAAGLPGLPGTVVRTGALPMAGLGLMASAAPRVPTRRTTRKRKKSRARRK